MLINLYYIPLILPYKWRKIRKSFIRSKFYQKILKRLLENNGYVSNVPLASWNSKAM